MLPRLSLATSRLLVLVREIQQNPQSVEEKEVNFSTILLKVSQIFTISMRGRSLFLLSLKRKNCALCGFSVTCITIFSWYNYETMDTCLLLSSTQIGLGVWEYRPFYQWFSDLSHPGYLIIINSYIIFVWRCSRDTVYSVGTLLELSIILISYRSSPLKVVFLHFFTQWWNASNVAVKYCMSEIDILLFCYGIACFLRFCSMYIY